MEIKVEEVELMEGFKEKRLQFLNCSVCFLWTMVVNKWLWDLFPTGATHFKVMLQFYFKM